jgi:hypothetical protein
LSWGGKNPLLRLLIDGEEFTFSTEVGVIEVVGAELEPKAPPEPRMQVEMSVPPIDWGDSLPRVHNREPYITINVMDASSVILRTPFPAYASVDLVYAKTNPSNPSTFTNVRSFSKREFEVVIVSETDGTLLEQSQAILIRVDTILGNALGEFVFIELLVLILFFFALGVFRGGLE